MIKPYKAPVIRQETDVIVEPKYQDQVIEPALAQTAPSPAASRSAGESREPGRRGPLNTDALQAGR